MSETIEQRWKAVGVERETLARELYQFATSKYATTLYWSKLPDWRREDFREFADTLLRMIEKAVREGKAFELRAVRGWLRHGDGDQDYLDGRIKNLEAGNA